MRIREAFDADDVAVGDLLVRSFAAQYARKMPDVIIPAERLADLRNQAEKRAVSTVFVAEMDGKIIGTVALYRWGASGSEAWIEGAADLRLLAIDPAHQGLGLSHCLLDEAEHRAQNWEASAICLHARRGAMGVARLYQSRGYRRDPAGDIDHLPQIYLEAYALRIMT